MRLSHALIFSTFAVVLWFGLSRCAAQEPGKTVLPSAAAIRDLLQKEPLSPATWPVWRKRLLDWWTDRSRDSVAAHSAALAFVEGQADAQGKLQGDLAKDFLAWFLLGRAYLENPAKARGVVSSEFKAEMAFRKCLELEPRFALAHCHLAMAMLYQTPRGQPALRAGQIEQELKEATRLNPALTLNREKGIAAIWQQRHLEAERLFLKAVEEDPESIEPALWLASAVAQNPKRTGPRAPQLKKLIDRFPASGELACMNCLALAWDKDFRAAYRELERARTLGADVTRILGAQDVHTIEAEGTPGLLERFGWLMLYFAGFYAAVMLVMAGAGLLLAARTRGSRALKLLHASPDHLVDEGQVVRFSGETLLARLYALALVAGLVLFYASIPFVIVGLLGCTAALLYLIFQAGRIPIKLAAVIVIFGFGAAWAVLKSLFTKPASGSFGLPKTAADCPRLHQAIAGVARRVDTDPVDEVYVAPGSEIGVHQEGRGPFGMFGVKRRVLTLGLSTMRFLTVGELEAILAHEYAHFSHRDTFYSRFIYQVHVSIGQALWGMGQAGGVLNYVNPFYWFLYLYYRCYSLLSAGFSRSREFLADRMASSLSGSDVFADALTKVCTDGMLFEKTIYGSIAGLLDQQQAFVNMYEAFHQYRDEQLGKEERDAEFEKLLTEKGSLFAQHPTVAERLEAVAALPPAAAKNSNPALQLFENPEEMEQELTRFMTDYVCAIQQVQAQAAAAGAE